MRKRICIILSLIMIMSVFSGLNFSAEATTTMTFAQIQAKFPTGKYWNHSGSSTNNPDGVTSIPCTHHNPKASYCSSKGLSGWCGCNSYNNGAIQCHGFALKMASLYYGNNPNSWNKVYNLNSLKAGDIIRYKNNGHSIWVTAVNGNTITYGDCNSDGHCGIKWNKTISKSAVLSTLTYVRSAPYKMNTVSTTHIHSYDTFAYYWKEHPHYKCYKCSCGDIKTNYNQKTVVDSCAQCNASATHTHSFSTYVYYEKEHPHYKWYKCSCGEIERNTNETVKVDDCSSCHVHSYDTFVYYWKEHPHYRCYKCSCGDIKADNTQLTKLDSCEKCNTPHAELKDFSINTDIINCHTTEIDGDIISNRGVKWAWIGIRALDGTYISYTTVTPWTYSYELDGINSKLEFEKLENGEYIFQIDCQDFEGNYFVLTKTKITVRSPIFSLEGTKNIPDLTVGENFSIDGKVYCDNGIRWVWVGLLDENKNQIQYFTATPMDDEYDYAQLASNIDFSVLPSGEYLFAVNAMDYNYNYYVPLKIPFSVTNPSTEPEHNYELIVIREADCENEGLQQYVCSICGDISIEETIPPIGHEFEEVRLIKEANCMQNGEYIMICSACGKKSDPVVIEKCDHNYIPMELLSTCSGNEAYKYQCSECGDIFVDELGHDFEDDFIAPTENERGYTLRTCSRCGFVQKDYNTDYTSDSSALEAAIIDAHKYYHTTFTDESIERLYAVADGYKELVRNKAPQFEYDLAVEAILNSIQLLDPLADYSLCSFDGVNAILENDNGRKTNLAFSKHINEACAPLDIINDGVINAKDFAYLIKNYSE